MAKVDKKGAEAKLLALNEKYNAFGSKEEEFIPSGSVIWDAVLSDGKGVPRGRSIEVASLQGVGKSTSLLHILKTGCSLGYKAAYIDFEGGVNKSQLDGVGLTPYLNDKFYLFQIQTFEEAEEIFDIILEGDFAYIVVDSAPAMLPGELLEKSVSDVLPGLQARYMSLFLQKYKLLCQKANITTFYVNQMRTKLNFRGMSTTQAAGGNALKFYMDIRLEMKKSKDMVKTLETLEGKKEIKYGAEVELYATKNRYNSPYVVGVTSVLFGKGISNLAAYTRWLTNNGNITMKGAGFYTLQLGELELKARGQSELMKVVKENLGPIKEFIANNGGFQLIQGEGSEDDE